MNKCCKDAKNYINNNDEISHEELQQFIDEFNIKLQTYSTNGLSSYLLSCFDLCLKLSKTIGYSKGEVVTKWLKGHILFLGGQYELAEKCYSGAINLLDKNDKDYDHICCSMALNMAYLGDVSKSIELVERLVNQGCQCHCGVNSVLSIILKNRGENELSFDLLNRSSSVDQFDSLQKINRLIELGRVDDALIMLNDLCSNISLDHKFFIGYTKSLDLLIRVKKGEQVDNGQILGIIDSLSSRNSFYHYIDGLLNISQIYITLNDFENSFKILETILKSKKSLVALDNRIYKQLESIYINRGDYKSAHNCNEILHDIINKFKTFDIDKSLRDMTSFLYSEEGVIS